MDQNRETDMNEVRGTNMIGLIQIDRYEQVKIASYEQIEIDNQVDRCTVNKNVYKIQ